MARLNINMLSYQNKILISKIRRFHDRFIFVVEIQYLDRRSLYQNGSQTIFSH